MVGIGARAGGRTTPLVLHDPPPGYRPPRTPSWYLLVNERHARVIVAPPEILVLAAAAAAVIMALMIAGYH